ncbi:MAG: DUF3369 domain-containing protein [Candidatus Eremiobacteraeota bacterium]|nr:DUF3369 domain-containing protein [Candidatus Eremiobacteraeota bacterium]MBV9407837.1 DUF3369 domain-containing protein [Candidatus Eremiobacteraeota bacterium]
MLDELTFAPESTALDDGAPRPWKVLVVDDEPDVHAVTRLALGSVQFGGRPIELLHAASAAEARRMLLGEEDVALALIDVVMETDDAGLRLVREIRERIENRLVRIVLRTGQPGQAPEREVIVDYDINDYKAKTELTSQRLFTTVVAALRAYEQLVALETSRRGLERILEGSEQLLHLRSMEVFASGVLTQVGALLGIGGDGILCVSHDAANDLVVFASSGRFTSYAGNALAASGDTALAEQVGTVMSSRRSRYGTTASTLYTRTTNGRSVVIHVAHARPLETIERKLVEVFVGHVAVGIDNLALFDDVRRAHRATVESLAVLAEIRDPETHAHVLRVSMLAERLARRLAERSPYAAQLDERYIDALALAAVMHDVGKATTPEAILGKPGSLDDEERTIMRQHTIAGRRLLERACQISSDSLYLRLGAEIAGGHHERWDGAGYPVGLAGENIPLSARIVAVADVYDALVSRRAYKEAWPHDEAVSYILAERGRHFDPVVVDAFIETAGGALRAYGVSAST